MKKTKQDHCEKHGKQTFLKLENWPGFSCIKCIATSMYPLSALCELHHDRLRVGYRSRSLNRKFGYCDSCDDFYDLCDVKFSVFGDGRYVGYECTKLKNHQGKHESPYGLEYEDTEKPKMDFEGGVFRRVENDY